MVVLNGAKPGLAVAVEGFHGFADADAADASEVVRFVAAE